MKHEPIPTNQVLDWLAANHPDLVEHAELDRAWTWLVTDLRDKPEVRASLKEYGFVFARRGHTLPSGAQGTWGHSSDAPMPFKRRGRESKPSSSRQQEDDRPRTNRTIKSHHSHTTDKGSVRYDPLAQPAPVPVPAPQAASPVDLSEVDPAVLAWLG